MKKYDVIFVIFLSMIALCWVVEQSCFVLKVLKAEREIMSVSVEGNTEDIGRKFVIDKKKDPNKRNWRMPKPMQ